MDKFTLCIALLAIASICLSSFMMVRSYIPTPRMRQVVLSTLLGITFITSISFFVILLMSIPSALAGQSAVEPTIKIELLERNF